MELMNTNNSDFKLRGVQILQEKEELLILVRYPYQAGNKDFFIVQDINDFRKFLNERKAKESITIFKEFETVRKGTITREFITEINKNITKPNGSDWIVYVKDYKSREINWSWCENKLDLLELLEEDYGKYVTIIEDLDYFDEELIFHAYKPDEDGEVRIGTY